MNSLPVGIELYDNDGTISFLNDTDAAIFGISDIEGAIRKKPSIYDNPNVPDCVKNAVYSKKPISVRFPYNFKTIAQTKYYSTNKNNDDVWVECNGKPIIDPNGRIGSYTFVMEDVTEKTRAEEELKESNQKAELILNNINSGLAYITPDYVVQWENMVKCSTAFPNGAYRQGELCYKSTYNRRSPCENCVIQRAAVSHRVEQMRIFLEENRMVELFATPVFRNTGEIDGFVIRIDDITDKERMIKELKHAEESDRLKSVFLANMSHEIRTPLNAIVGFSNLLVETNDPDEKEEYTRIINNNNELLLKLISDILDLSKIESGSVKLKYEDFDLSGYFDELAVSMKQRITNPDVNLVIVNRYDKCLVCLDKNRVAQILTNYMINAIKYTVKGTIEMGYDATKSGIYFYVKDSGIGTLMKRKTGFFIDSRNWTNLPKGPASDCRSAKLSPRQWEVKSVSNLPMVKGPYFGRHYLVKQKVRFRDHILDLLHGQKGTELFQIFRIHLVKLAQLVAVDIQYGNHFSISDHRYDNFRPRGGATGDMPRKLLHIRDDDCPCFFPGCPAYAFPVPDTRTGKRTLERGEHEHLFFHDIKAYPEKIECLFQGSGDIRHIGDDVCFSRCQRL